MKNLFLITLLSCISTFCMEYLGEYRSFESEVMATHYSEQEKSLLINIVQGNYSLTDGFSFTGENNEKANIEFPHFNKKNKTRYTCPYLAAKNFVAQYNSRRQAIKRPLVN